MNYYDDDHDDDDAIGYGNPPRYTRFRKGKSGNPKGRPRREKPAAAPPDTDLDDSLRKLLNREMTIKLGGKEQRFPVFQVIALKQQEAALAGSVTAQRDVMRAKEKLAARDALRNAQAEVKALEEEAREQEAQGNLYDYLIGLHAEQTRVYELAETTDTVPDPRYPHPADFKFDHREKRAAIKGPWDDADAGHYTNIAKQRDYHLVDLIILSRQRPKASRFSRRLSNLQTVAFDMLLPSRQQLCGRDLEAILSILYMLPMCDLRAWRRELDLWLKMNPLPAPTKKTTREINKFVNDVMKPILKPLGFCSVADLEHRLESDTA